MGHSIQTATAIALFFSATLAFAAPNSQVPSVERDRCVAFAEIGLIDRKYTQTDYDQLSKFFSYAMHKRDMTYERARSSALSANIPFGDVLVGLTGSSDSKAYESLRTMDESHVENYLSTHYSGETYEQKASPIVASLAEKCLEQGGINAWIEVDPKNRTRPILRIKYVAGNLFDPKPVKVTISSDKNFPCELDGVEVSDFKIEVGRDRVLSCTRERNDIEGAALLISAEQTMFSGGNLWLPPTAVPEVVCHPMPKERFYFGLPREELKPETIGPYCGATLFVVGGTAESRAQSATGERWAQILIYKDAADVSNIICDSIQVQTNLNSDTTVSASCPGRPVRLPARTTQKLVLLLKDAQSDSHSGQVWVDVVADPGEVKGKGTP